METVVELLQELHSPSGEDPNASLQEAEHELNEYGCAPDFCACLLEIISTQDIEPSTHHMATILLSQIIEKYWEEEMADETKGEILSNFVQIAAAGIEEGFYGTVSKFSATVVNATGLEWPDLFSIMQSGFASEDASERIIALMLAKAVSMQFHCCSTDEDVQMYEELCSTLLPPLTEIVQGSADALELSIAYQIARHLSFHAVPPVFAENIDMLNIWFEKALEVCKESEDPNWLKFVRCAVKFCTEYFSRKMHNELIDPEYKVNLMYAIVPVTNPEMDPKVLGRCVQFMKFAMIDNVTWECICQNSLIEFTTNVLLPLYALDEYDMMCAEDDPEQFLDNFHKVAVNTSDPRSFMWGSLRSLCNRKNRCPDITTVFVRLLKFFAAQTDPRYDCSKYSMCHLFSSIIHTLDPEQSEEISGELVALLEHDSFIVRAGALVALRPLRFVHPQVIIEVIPLLEDPSVLVEYFAALALSSLLDRVREDSEVAASIQEECAPMLSGILTTYFRIAQEFNDYQLMEFTRSFVCFFGEQLMEIACEFAVEMYRIFLCHCDREIVLSSIAKFLEMMENQPDIANETVIGLLAVIDETFGDLEGDAVRLVVELLGTIVYESPEITENHWKIIELLSPIQFDPSVRDEVCTTYKNLIIKDQETARNPEFSENLISLAVSFFENHDESSELRSAISLSTTLLIALSQTETDPSILEVFLKVVADGGFEDEGIAQCVSMLICGMLIFNAPVTLEIIGEQRAELIEQWLSNAKCNMLIPVVLKCHDAFSAEELSDIVLRCAVLIQEDVQKFADQLFPGLEEEVCERIEKENHVFLKSAEMFDQVTVLEEFAQFVQTLETSVCPGIMAAIEETIEEPLIPLIERLAEIVSD